MNKTFITGNLTKDVETRETASGALMARFSVAVKRPYSKDETDFFDVTAWRSLAEICGKYLKKGSKVALVGYFTSRSYEDNQGIKRKVWDFNCEEMEMLSSNQAQPQEEQPRRKPTLTEMYSNSDDSDIPF
jgi:single-strand DNA-binding protein